MNRKNLPKELPPELLKRILADRRLMIALVRRSFFHFFYIFFGEYIDHPMAPFHHEMFRYAQDPSNKRILVIAFRGSAKSTIYNTALALWMITSMKKRHVVIAGRTQQRAYDHSANIAREVERNVLLKKYLGPFEQEEGRWSVPVRVIPRYDARISFVSVEEGIRGLREGPNRPDLIIVDDIEDYESITTREGREKTFQWLTGELIPAGDIDTTVVFIGNFLHEDAALMRIARLMERGEMEGKFLQVPIVDDQGNIAWPGKFPTLEAIEEFRKSIGNEQKWQLEFMLRSVSSTDRVVDPAWISYYDRFPGYDAKGFRYTATGVDLAISESDAADYTATVSASVFNENGKLQIYIHPNPVNERLNFPDARARIKQLSLALGGGRPTKLFIEAVEYQPAMAQELRNEGFPAEEVKIQGHDKRARLALVTHLIQSGQIQFARIGCEFLIQQLVGFPMEKYDDQVDAFSLLILKIIEENSSPADGFFRFMQQEMEQYQRNPLAPGSLGAWKRWADSAGLPF